MRYLILLLFLLAPLAFAQDNLDIHQELQHAMETFNVPVVGYALIENNKISSANTISIDSNVPVDKRSLFQAASITKTLTAYAVLLLAQEGKLSLDKTLNEQLARWQLPDNAHTQKQALTPRHVLAMTSGLSIAGFPGYGQRQPLPTLQQLLDGKAPANHEALRVMRVPGEVYAYTSGSFEVLEQLIEETTGQPYVAWMRKTILRPLKMKHSYIVPRLPANLVRQAIPGFQKDGSVVKGGWHNYAALASASLWTTPADVATFMINISKSYLGQKGGLLQRPMAEQMLTRQKNSSFGLGLQINGSGKSLNFSKHGHNAGYHAQMFMFPNTGQGIIIMTNSENGNRLIQYMLPIFAHEYHWPCFFPYLDESIKVPHISC